MPPHEIGAFDGLMMQRRNGFIVSADIGEKVQARARGARRFVFDADASRRVGEVVHDIPELLARENAFARPPFDRSWIELDFRAYYATATGNEADDMADRHIGFFFDHDQVYTVVTGHHGGGLGQIGMIGYRLHTPWSLTDQLAFIDQVGGLSRMGLDGWLWGSAINKVPEADRRALRSAHSAFVLPLRDIVRGKITAKDWVSVMQGAAGELKIIIATLLLLNRPALTTYREVPRSKGFLKGKLHQYLAHTVVSINVDPRLMLRTIGTAAGEAVHKRRHEVRGFWRHDDAYRAGQRWGCVHDWETTERFAGSDTHFTCKGCQGERWWVRSHMRGSAMVGFVAHDGYDVTGGPVTDQNSTSAPRV